ncbi:MAG TPA: tRNA preQ1(34) S-adenosylmethionine ribosyltransferase-isomerase QueA [Candidatus Binatia bacterium]|nr:tRNA preQ1(34) S-adenosylmethionine ribosyltransferase-isomerase QueA [Candidatus Binatia bacterium]
MTYDLPESLIAQQPAAKRDDARLMIVDRRNGTIRHERIPAIVDELAPGDRLVLNDTRVYPARLYGRKESGGRVELLVLALEEGTVPAIARASKPLREGQRIQLPGGYAATVRGPVVEGRCRLDFGDIDVSRVVNEVGDVPLPPYIARPEGPSASDRERYQTVYARSEGSVAAPTAGLHFTPEILSALGAKGIDRSSVTLHVGPGTFSPVRGPLTQHRMEEEACSVPAAEVVSIGESRARGGRIVAVGTTTVRALETAAAAGQLASFHGRTDLFIQPGHRFRTVDALLTNFHLPGSTLLCLIMAFAGIELTRHAYETAVAERYRFYSFGDAMLVL